VTTVTTDSQDLETRLRRLEDLTAINQLFVDYGVFLDSHDFEGYASLFADDGEILLGPLGRAKGPEQIRQMMEKNLGPVGGGSFHLVTSPRVELDGDKATAKVMWTVIQRDGDGKPFVGMIGHHIDELVRRDGRWLFFRRAGRVDIPSAYPTGK